MNTLAADVFASAFRDPRPAVALVGAGAAGRALALRLADCGYPVRAVISRSLEPAQALARAVGAPCASNRIANLPDDAPLVMLCVPDDALSELAEALVSVRPQWRGTVVAHTSGALPAQVLAPLAAAGADVLSFHPLQTLTAHASPDTLRGAPVGLEGAPRAVAAGIELAAGLGMRYLVLSAEAKPRYHLAAAMASNFVVALLGMAQEVLASLDVDRRDAMALLEPLVRGTLDNLARDLPEEALTGPVVRGDLATVRSHGAALRGHLPHLLPAYAALSVEAVRLGVRSGRLDPERAEETLTLLQHLLMAPVPPRPPRAQGLTHKGPRSQPSEQGGDTADGPAPTMSVRPGTLSETRAAGNEGQAQHV